MCKYTAEHLWAHMLLMFLCRSGSRNAFDHTRNSGGMAFGVAAACGQSWDDPRFENAPTVTCSDNVARHASRTDPARVAELPARMIRTLLDRRVFDGSRLDDGSLVVVVDGSVQEKCRKGFEADGKAAGNAKYRYIMQASILLHGHALPFLHEPVDVHDPVAEKEDCEINAFKRLAPRLKAAFPKLPLLICGDSLYACTPIAERCVENEWHFNFTFKQGRTPAIWQEAGALLALAPENRLQIKEASASPRTRDFQWASGLPFGKRPDGSELLVTAICETETTPTEQTFYAWITDLPWLGKNNLVRFVDATGRSRHAIEDQFNAEKNNGVGLEHVFCANATGSKNYYSIMQCAQIIWTLFHGGHLARLYGWAWRASQVVLARAIGEGLRLFRADTSIRPVGQMRFVT